MVLLVVFLCSDSGLHLCFLIVLISIFYFLTGLLSLFIYFPVLVQGTPPRTEQFLRLKSNKFKQDLVDHKTRFN